MDFVGTLLKGFVLIILAMVSVYVMAVYGGEIAQYTMPIFLLPVWVGMVMGNEPTRKGFAAAGLTGMAIIIIAGSTTIVWGLLLTIPPIVGYSVGVREFREWDSREVNDEPDS